MIKSMPLALTLFSLASVGTAFADDSLFSRVATDSVFTTPTEGTTPETAPEITTPVDPPANPAPADSLKELLISAGLSATSVREGAYSVEVKSGDIPFAVLIDRDASAPQLKVVVMLSAVGDGRMLPTEAVLALMDANRKYHPATFAFSADSRRFGLQKMLPMDGLSPAQLRSELERMTAIAAETRNLWMMPGTVPVPAAPMGSTITGRWTATPAEGNALALQLNADGTFRMVIVRGNSPAKSQGTFESENGTLTLIGDDGTRLEGGLDMQDGGFLFRLPSSTLTFQRAN